MRVHGRVYFDHGMPALRLRLLFFQRGFAGNDTALGEAMTGRDGEYEFAHDTRISPFPLEVRCRGAEGEREITLTDSTLSIEGEAEELNLVVPEAARPLQAEYERLHADLRLHVEGGRLGAAVEDEDRPEGRRDLSFLHRATGWDARVVALAAKADRLSEATGVEPEALYAALRVGLPADPHQLARVSRDGFRRAIRKANAERIVDLEPDAARRAETAFARFARTGRRQMVVHGARSSHEQMLAAARLSGDEQDRLDELVADHDGTEDELWEKLREADLPVDRVRLTARLGFLTFNNAELVQPLAAELDRNGDLAAGLVGARLYRMEAWAERLRSAADGDAEALDAMIPPAFAGATTDERLAAYTEDLARKVRRSYPTEVVAHMVEHDELRLGPDHDDTKEDVATVLGRATARDFELGRTPVNAFVRDADNAAVLFDGIAPERAEAATEQLRALHRTWQITPNDEAMKVMFANGLTSAYKVASMTKDKFLSRYGEKFASVAIAEQIYRKAQQVSTVTWTVFPSASEIANAPPLPGGMYTPPAVAEQAKNELIKHYPTMEELFGSLDFCECEHCRSVLSPAAYLVDLLKFIDPDAGEWTIDIDDWPHRHASAPYPFLEPAEQQSFEADWIAKFPNVSIPALNRTPYEVLTARRPDLPALPLTCENTHTAMPYIDIVNEILEYYVRHKKLEPAAGHDTGDAQTADLIAEPEHIDPEAYTILAEARYPLTLPFDLWLETVRRFCDHFDTPLWSLLDVLRPTDDLYLPGPPTEEVPYARSSVFLERLGIPAVEQDILTNPDPVATWHELYGYESSADALAQLPAAKTLARRLGVTYKELVELVRGGFVNPRLEVLAALRKLGIGTEDVLRYLEQPDHKPFDAAERAAFEAKLEPVGGIEWLKGAWERGDFKRVLVLHDPDAGCGFENTTLRYADGTALAKDPKAGAVTLLLLNYIVRLRRRLGWSFAELDRALQVFLPREPDPRTPTTLGPAMATALLGLAHLDVLNSELKGGKTGRLALLVLWSELDDARYVELFLAGKTRAPDLGVFDDPLGDYLSTPDVPLAPHLGAVQAALQLTADDVARILADAGQSLETAVLDLATVSLLRRYGLLAKLLKLPVADLIAIKTLSELDPFEPLNAGPVTTMAEDHPHEHTVRFVEQAAAVEESGLSADDLGYLFRHEFDPVGEHRPAGEPPLALVRTLASEIERICTEHAVPKSDQEALAFTDDVIRQKLALVLPPDVVETFLAMWTYTIEYRSVLDGVAEPLDPADYADAPRISVSQQPAGRQHLIHRGVLTKERADELKAEFGPGEFDDLIDQVWPQPGAFFDKHLLTEQVGGEQAGFLAADDFEPLFAPPDGADPAAPAAEAAQAARRRRLAEAFLPYLQDRLIRQLVVETAAADLGAEPALVEALAGDPALLDDPDQAGRPLLDLYSASAASKASAAATGDADSMNVEGYLEVATGGPYRFSVVCEKQGAHVELRFDHLADPLLSKTAADDGEAFAGLVELQPGVAYGFAFEATALGGGTARITVRGEELPEGPLDNLTFYTREVVDDVRRAHLLLAKVLRLAGALELTERELRHLLTHPDDFDSLDLGALPTSAPVDIAHAQKLFGWFLKLVDYLRLRRALPAEPDDMVDLLEHARRTIHDAAGAEAAEDVVLGDLAALLGDITRRDPAAVLKGAEMLGMDASASGSAPGPFEVTAPDFANEQGLGRLWRLLAIATELGVSPEALAAWATPRPDQAVAADLRDTLKARYAPAAWRRVVQPISDALRRRRRDALVAHVMHTDGFDRIEQLFEYFLIDPGMEPVVQTSRLRLAISSVQLFIQRCLLNLERFVHPSAIDSAHWQWMKRYRVWEANRKIFLWPENWLEPEWRDDKTHLFAELESALMESDLSNDSAERALFAYLRGLDELARLDVRAVHLEEGREATRNVLHVVARTFGTPHKYFYRTYKHHMWTPWVPITAEIEGDHVAVTVWRGRVHIFWVKFVERAQPRVGSTKTPNEMLETPLSEIQPKRWVDIQLSWTEYFQGEWTDPSASRFLRERLLDDATAAAPFVADDEFIRATIDEDDAVRIHLTQQLDKYIRVISKNAPITLHDGADDPETPPFLGAEIAGPGRFRANHFRLSAVYADTLTQKGLWQAWSASELHHILEHGGGGTIVTHGDRVPGVPEEIAPLVNPFFYSRGRDTFYVEPTLTDRTRIQQADGWLWEEAARIPEFDDDLYWEEVDVRPQVPYDPAVVERIAASARYPVAMREDWVTAPEAVVHFGKARIGAAGAVRARVERIGRRLS